MSAALLERTLPCAPCVAVDSIRPGGVPIWVVACPFCGSVHVHGVGEGPAQSDCVRGAQYFIAEGVCGSAVTG